MADLSYDEVLARNIRAARARLGLTQQSLADRMRALGYTAWLRQTVPNVEKGNRRVLAGEIFGLAFALETTIPALMAASPDDKVVRFPSGGRVQVAPMSALAQTGGFSGLAVTWKDDVPVFAALRRYTAAIHAWETLGPEDAYLNLSLRHVAVAIVTSGRRVLAGRRNDGQPPWTFIAGEVEPGERPEDAAVREVKEEAGLEVRVGERIGKRVHPETGRTLIYMSAEPTHGTDVYVGDEAELAEVRWLTLAEAGELLPDMFGQVREYLARALAHGEQQ